MTHRKYLATTAISGVWDLDRELLLLGPWCLTEDTKKLLEGRHYALVESPWRPFASKVREAADYCFKIYEEILPELGRELNNLHSVSYPEEYWRVLFGPWLLYFIGVLYERFKRLENAFRLYPDSYTHVLPRSSCNLATWDTRGFWNNSMEDDFYNLKIFSIIAHHMGVSSREISGMSEVEIKPVVVKRNWKRKLFQILARPSLAKFLTSGHVVLAEMYHLSPLDYLRLSMKTGLGLFHFIGLDSDFRIPEGCSGYSPGIRQTLKLGRDKEGFKRLLCQAIPSAIPMCFMENYHSYRNSVDKLNSVRVIGSVAGWYVMDRFKFSVAEAVARGARLADFQQGGGYATPLVSAHHEGLSLGKELLYTWGWDYKVGYWRKRSRLPSPHLSKLRDTYAYRVDKVLYVGTWLPRYPLRFQTGSSPEEFVSYPEDTKKFLCSLPEGLRPYILYRPEPSDTGCSIKNIVKDACPQAELLINLGAFSRLTDWMRKVRICVIDHPYTSYIEALAINVPCIFFWNHDVYVMRPEAEESFELLRKAGILYKNPEEAAAKLSEVFDDPWTWWGSEEVQGARNSFLEKFGYSSKDWLDRWAAEVRSLNSGIE